MDFDNLPNVEREKHAQLRAAICKKYAAIFWNEHNANELPNLALIINDAIGEAVEQHFKVAA